METTERQTMTSVADGISMYIVGNNSILNRVVSEFLGQQSTFTVMGAAPKSEAILELIHVPAPSVILVFLSVFLKTDLRFIEWLRKCLPFTGIIAITGVDAPEYWNAVFSAGADSLLLEQNLSNDLLPAVQKIVEEKESCKHGTSRH